MPVNNNDQTYKQFLFICNMYNVQNSRTPTTIQHTGTCTWFYWQIAKLMKWEQLSIKWACDTYSCSSYCCRNGTELRKNLDSLVKYKIQLAGGVQNCRNRVSPTWEWDLSKDPVPVERLIESYTTLREGWGNPIRVSKIFNTRRGLPSRACCKSWKWGWDSRVPPSIWYLLIFLNFAYKCAKYV